MNIKPKLNYETVELTKIKKAVQLCLSKETIQDVKTEVELNCLLDAYFINILKDMLALKAGDRIIRYPKNWKEAFRERWFPQWMKKRFPIKYREYDVLVIFPDLLKEFPVPMQLKEALDHLDNIVETFVDKDVLIGDEPFVYGRAKDAINLLRSKFKEE